MSNAAKCRMLADDTTLHTTGKSVMRIHKSLLLCLGRVSMGCTANHMQINPVKTKSMLITTGQRHRLSDPSLRLSLDCQSIEQVTEHRLCRRKTSMASPSRSHMQYNFRKHISSLSATTFHQQRHKNYILQRPYKTSQRLCSHSLWWLWGGTLKKPELSTAKVTEVTLTWYVATYWTQKTCLQLEF